MNEVLARPALYYPYIHIRSEHWLKATLLCVPAVKRIVPETYTPEDLPRIIKYTKIEGPNGALLQAVPAYSHAAAGAQQRLLTKLREHDAEIKERFGQMHSPMPDEYWIHPAKFSDELLHYLYERRLAWPSDHSRAFGHRQWLALHPILGSAIMTTLGITIAREQHYDIVTDSGQSHETLLATKEEAIFEALLATHGHKPVPTAGQVRQDLSQLVVTLTGINFEALRPEDIPELQASKSFHKFQHLIRSSATNIERDDDPEIYKIQIQNEANEIIEAWQDSKGGLSSSLKHALFEGGLLFSEAALKALHALHDTTALAIDGGIAVGLLVSKGLALMEAQPRKSPYHYLTEIVKAQDEVLRLTFPIGLER
jgi:hypothetical protein